MNDSPSKKAIDELYSSLSLNADTLYRFVTLYNDYICQARDYGNGDLIKMFEVHTLTAIEDHPGITVTELAALCRRSKGTISVIVRTLEKKGYVYRQKENSNGKLVHLYPTASGIELSMLHKVYDNLNVMQTQASLLRSCTPQDLDSFYKVIGAYLTLFSEKGWD